MTVEFKGIILYSKNYQEKDRLVKIFTEQAGKKMFFVPNITRKNNPLRGATLNFQWGTFIGNLKSNGLSYLYGSKEIHPFHKIQNDLFLNAYATYLLNLADIALADHEYDPNLFDFLRKSLFLIDQGFDSAIITNIFELQITKRFGVQFNFSKCCLCGKTNGKFAFSYSSGGIICVDHLDEQNPQGIIKASPKIIHLARILSAVSFQQIKTINLKSATKQELRQFIDELYDEFIGIKLKSKKFIDQLIYLKQN